MKPLYSAKEFNNTKSSEKLLIECYNCQSPFNKTKKYIQLLINQHKNEINNYSNSCKYCSKLCQQQSMQKKLSILCSNCNNTFFRVPKEIKKSKNHFCSRSCAVTYNNKNKTTGTRRSKLEIWLEQQLPISYPQLKFIFNDKTAIGSELDIYIPTLRMAFELNGIFHFEPIYGPDKLSQIQSNDQNKYQGCYEHGIALCIIDTSKQKYFKESTSKEFLDIIKYHIDWGLNSFTGLN